MPVEKYTIIVEGERFSFTRDQLDSDPGNFFATYFSGGFPEVPYGTKEMEIEKEPLLFRLIQAHLRGYDVLPLSDQFVPPYMTKEGALNNLLKEAAFYGLWNLQSKIQEYQKTTKANTAKAKALERLPRRKYKLAQYKQSGWAMCDLAESGYKALLSRFISSSEFQLLAPTSLVCPGYTLVACWKDAQHDEDSTLGLPRLCICALLESDL